MTVGKEFGAEITAPGLHGWLVTHALSGVSKEGGVLDLGCGAGAWLRRLEASGYKRLVGVDRDTQPISTANLRIMSADLECQNLGLDGEKFGLVTLVEVIEHMHNPGALLRVAESHLAEAGAVLITTPNIHSLIQRVKFFLTGRFAHFDSGSDPTHYQPVLLDAWKRMLSSYGLELDSVTSWPQSRHLGGVHPAWKYLAGMASLVAPDPLPGECLVVRLRRSIGSRPLA